ncbi:MAG TPA: carbohydrate ABC transporter permease [Rectinemataceae bacterium]|nr:carbohydrate ABC transporter permease [Rectinemataceae bacterium]
MSAFRTRHGASEIAATAILAVLALVVILPLVMPLLFAFKTQLEFSYHPWALPKRLLVINFVEAWKAVRIDQGLANTLIVSLGAIVCTLPPAALAGYVFARYRSRATEIAFYAILVGYFVPAQMVLVPLYKMEVAVKLNNTLYGLFLPMAAFGIPFWMMIYRSFFKSLPGELAEAARIDGAGHSATFFRVMLPLARPATVLALILVFIGAWSDYLLSLILLSDQRLFTMQLRVASFLNAYGTDRMPRYAAAAIISAAPTVILYIVGHRWIIRGTLAGAVKE